MGAFWVVLCQLFGISHGTLFWGEAEGWWHCNRGSPGCGVSWCQLCGGVRRNVGKGRWMMHWEVMVLQRDGPE